MICSFPRTQYGDAFRELYAKGGIELEIVAQGTLTERIRAAGAGIGAFYTPTTAGTPLAEGKETRELGGRDHVLEYPLAADFALVKAARADRWGNLTYNKSARNFGPSMCMAAATTIVQAREIVELGAIDPEHVVTPGIFVDRVVEVPDPISEHEAIQKQAEG
jgi:3-oxoadipate CoA-transferase alpha subunit